MSLPRYPKYKESGVEWIGQVPGHWRVGRLLYLCELIVDGTHHSPQSELSGDRLYVTAKNIKEHGIDLSDVTYVTEADHGEIFARCPVQKEDVLYIKDGATAGVATVNRLSVEFSLLSSVAVIRPLPTLLLPGYVARHLNAAQFKEEVLNRLVGGAMTRFTLDSIGRFTFAIPPIPEQAAIIGFLDRETAKIDALVAEQERLIELLKEKRQAVISHAVTKGLNPDALMKNSGIEWVGDVPAHWGVMLLKRVADVHTGVAKGKDHSGAATISVPYLRVANVQDGYLDLETVAEIDIPADDLDRHLLRSGDVLMNEGGDFDKLGRGHIWQGQIDPCITQNHVFAVRPRKVSSHWLNAVTGSDYAQFYFMTRSKQSTNLASISSTNLMELPVVLPPANEQEAILMFTASQTSRFDTLTVEAQRAIELLQERRTALISAAVTGQIDVRGAAERSAVGSADAFESRACM